MCWNATPKMLFVFRYSSILVTNFKCYLKKIKYTLLLWKKKRLKVWYYRKMICNMNLVLLFRRILQSVSGYVHISIYIGYYIIISIILIIILSISIFLIFSVWVSLKTNIKLLHARALHFLIECFSFETDNALTEIL